MAYWILQGNPEIYDTHGALEAETITTWRVARHVHDISPGDEFALWISGPGGGVVALGMVTEPAMRDTDTDGSAPFWVDPTEGGRPAWRIGIQISRKLGAVIRRTDLREDPGFASSMILRMPGGGNAFPVTPDEWLTLQSHIPSAETERAGHRQPLSPADVLALLNDRQASDDLVQYFGTAAIAEPPAFTGSRFDTLNGGGARPDTRDKITAADLIAVQCLGASVPATVSLDLLDGHLGTTLSAYLRHIPCGIALGDEGARGHVQPGSPAELAWHLLTQQYGVNWVIAGKILARKRPKLIPVYDRVVKCAMGHPENAWLWLDDLFRWNDAVTDQLGLLHHDARLPDYVPQLRVLDAVVWMRHREHHRDKDCPGIIR
jgi:predicted RNA-binding protein with PUA-like domain